LIAKENKSRIPFSIINKESNKAVGLTTYMDISEENKHLEIGYTWYGAKYHRTSINTETKLLLLTHAFEELECIRVQLKTDLRNIKSQKAIERIGGIKEGIIRKFLIMHDGHQRDHVLYRYF
jgi:N-acetyltransferase